MFSILLILSLYAPVTPSWLCLLYVHDQGKCFDFKFILNHQTIAYSALTFLLILQRMLVSKIYDHSFNLTDSLVRVPLFLSLNVIVFHR